MCHALPTRTCCHRSLYLSARKKKLKKKESKTAESPSALMETKFGVENGVKSDMASQIAVSAQDKDVIKPAEVETNVEKLKNSRIAEYSKALLRTLNPVRNTESSQIAVPHVEQVEANPLGRGRKVGAVVTGQRQRKARGRCANAH
jgi:hypothetical protein